MKASFLCQEQLGREHDKIAETEIETHLMEAGRLILGHDPRSNWQTREIEANHFQINSQNCHSEANCDN